MEQIRRGKSSLVLACAALALMLGGCNKANELASDASDYLLLRDANLMERNYAAADYLASRSGSVINKKTVLVPEPLMHANNTGMTSPFGEEVTNQIAERFAQLGYNVKLAQHNPAQARPAPAPIVAPATGVAIGGLYEPHWNSADIKLRLIDRKSGEILAFFDYSLPVNWQSAPNIKDRPTAFRPAE